MSLQQALSIPIDTLLSLRSTPNDQSNSLTSLELLLVSLVDPKESLSLDAFLILQDGFEFNLVGRLLEWLGRRLGDGDMSPEEQDAMRSNMARCLTLIQGLLLLHRRSQRLFARRASLEYLLAILTLSQSPTTPAPSPILLPPSPVPSQSSNGSQRSTSSSSTPPTPLALVVLDTLLCALVDRPRNVRTFEEVGGLGSVVGVLRDKSAVQVVRIKAVEILYYYLLPEPPSSSSRRNASDASTTSSSSSSRLHAEGGTRSSHLPTLLGGVLEDFVPQTPVKPRGPRPLAPPSPTPSSTSSLYRTHSSSSRSEDSTGRRRERTRGPRSPSQSPHRPPPSPSASPSPSRSTFDSRREEEGSPRAQRRDRKPLSLDPPSLPPAPSSSSSSHSSTTPTESLPPTSTPIVDSLLPPYSSGTSNGERKGRRTEGEKRELLRGYMGNVERLEERFRAMGLGGWEV